MNAKPILDLGAGRAPIAELKAKYARGEAKPTDVAWQALAQANSNIGRNTYITLDAKQVMAEAEMLPVKFHDVATRPLLYGVPVSVKDCFDMAGTATTAGTKFYGRKNPKAAQDSELVQRLRRLGAIVMGKTHLHPIAYGITGENAEFGDCLQSRDATRLTGGSSSGAAASVQERSALAAIGTDTGGSIRTPAALCGVVGYRASHGLAEQMYLWSGGMHLAPSFDTLGWLFNSAADAPLLGTALFDLEVPEQVRMNVRVGVVGDAFLKDCDAEIRTMYDEMKQKIAATGATLAEVDTSHWANAVEIFAPIQAHEAAAIHHGNFENFPKDIAERLTWGENFPPEKLQELRFAHTKFQMRMDATFDQFEYLLLPCAPVAKLLSGADHSKTRPKILRYTVPFSLGGNPVVTLPGGTSAGKAGGVQLAAGRGGDAKLLRYAAQLEQNL